MAACIAIVLLRCGNVNGDVPRMSSSIASPDSRPHGVTMASPDEFPLALTYDDVLLVPQRSSIGSRSDVDTTGRITPGISLQMPVVSANMDTVTEWRMAMAMARAGGIGIIHRFLSIEEQARQVAKVKRSAHHVIDEPYTIAPDASARAVVHEFAVHGINGLPVVDAAGLLLGLVTRRDLVASGLRGQVHDVMTPRADLLVSHPDTTLEQARELMTGRRVEKLPLVDGDYRLVGLITMQDVTHREIHPHATTDGRGRLRVGAAIGVRGDYLDRARACEAAGADVLCLDIAHGHAEHAIAAVRELCRHVELDIVAGNVATAAGARDLIEAGARGIKVGVGPGSVCTTRLVAGVGVPQLTAVLECARECSGAGIPLCADGGIRMPGDMAKAMAAGAESIMVGNLLAGTTESPGTLLQRDGRTVKVHRGMASGGAMERRQDVESHPDLDTETPRLERRWMLGTLGDSGEFGRAVPEGVEAVVPWRGGTAAALHELAGGLRSAMSYSDARTLEGFRRSARFVRITAAGQAESRPHDVEV